MDRGADDSSLGRDIIDLLLLEGALGELPREAFAKARTAYGDAVDRAYEGSRENLRANAGRRERFFEALGVAEQARDAVRGRL